MQPINLYPHQQKAVDQLDNGKILWGGVGTGKSLTAMAYFVSKVCKGTYGDFGSMRTPKDIYIITTAKKRDSLDWEEEAIKFGISKDRESSISNIQMTVDSWNNIEKYVGVKDAFFVFDEQRLVGSGAWAQTFIKIAKHNEWILLSATPGDTWLDYIPVFVANGWYRNRTAFKQRHVVYSYHARFPKVERYLETGTLVRYRNQILVHMPFERHTVRNEETIRVDYDVDLMNKVVNDRWHVYENRPLRDVAELFVVMRKVANSDDSRLREVGELLKRHPRLIVFYNFNYELEMLRSLVSETTIPTKSSKTLSKSSNEHSGHWTEDEGNGEFWIPNSTGKNTSARGSSSGKISLLSNDSRSSDEKDLSGAKLKLPKQNTSSGISTKETPLVVAEWNGHKHEPVPTSDRWLYLVQYTAGAEGWNCITTNAMCFWSLTYSYKADHQAHGRIDRLNTPFIDLYYYRLVSTSMIDRAVLRSLKAKKSFNERDLPLWKG